MRLFVAEFYRCLLRSCFSGATLLEDEFAVGCSYVSASQIYLQKQLAIGIDLQITSEIV